MTPNLDIRNKVKDILNQQVNECGMGEIAAPTVDATTANVDVPGDGSGDIPSAFTEDSDDDHKVLSFKTFIQKAAGEK